MKGGTEPGKVDFIAKRGSAVWQLTAGGALQYSDIVKLAQLSLERGEDAAGGLRFSQGLRKSLCQHLLARGEG